MMELYSCVPVLYGDEFKKDINLDDAKLRVVFDLYSACQRQIQPIP
jgi:hypothetical protein